MNPEITLAVTSCGRHDLLERTLRSFARYCGGLIAENVVVEDSDQAAPTWLADLENIGRMHWIGSGVRKAQIYSCDRLMAEVKTPYVFCNEDASTYFHPGFLHETLEI